MAGIGLTMLAACGGHAGAAAPSATSPVVPSATASSASAAARQAALAGYNGMWADEQVAAVTADYQSPLLAQHASGSALSLLVQGLYTLRRQQLVIKGRLATHPAVTSLTPPTNPTSAAVRDCFDDTHWLVYKATGGLQDDVPGGHRRVTATVTDVSGVWKVTKLVTGAEGTC